ncbi:MAG: helix-turn-helix transcriptional regulator [Clostridia bacterium]|nr:helix-turn-helix transcriptional regulator [Clostridia bacterium]
MEIYERLKQLREAAQLSQSDVAKILFTSQQYYGKYENGIRPMPMDRYVMLAKHYNVSLDYLTGLIDTPRPLK